MTITIVIKEGIYLLIFIKYNNYLIKEFIFISLIFWIKYILLELNSNIVI